LTVDDESDAASPDGIGPHLLREIRKWRPDTGHDGDRLSRRRAKMSGKELRDDYEFANFCRYWG
jgi:hypothetical protein